MHPSVRAAFWSPITKTILFVTGWIISLVSTGLLVWHLIEHANLDPKKWEVFFNAWLPMVWGRLTFLFVSLILLDLVFPGHTIATICDIYSSSDPEDKRTAGYFMMTMAICITWCLTGSPF